VTASGPRERVLLSVNGDKRLGQVRFGMEMDRRRTGGVFLKHCLSVNKDRRGHCEALSS
jgi:hypothetical protein